MSFKSNFAKRLKRPFVPGGYFIVSIFLPLTIVDLRGLWFAPHLARFWFYVVMVPLMIPLWGWQTLSALHEIGWSKYLLFALSMPLALLTSAEVMSWKKIEGVALVAQLIVMLITMIPRPKNTTGAGTPERNSGSTA